MFVSAIIDELIWYQVIRQRLISFVSRCTDQSTTCVKPRTRCEGYWKHFPASGLMFVPQWGLPQPRLVTSVLTTRLHPHNFLIILISQLGSRLLSQTSIISFPSSQRFGKTPRLGEDSDILRWSPVARTFTLGSSQLLVWIKQRYLPGPTWNQTWLACRKIPLRLGISQPCLMTLGGKPSLIISYPVISPLYPHYIPVISTLIVHSCRSMDSVIMKPRFTTYAPSKFGDIWRSHGASLLHCVMHFAVSPGIGRCPKGRVAWV